MFRPLLATAFALSLIACMTPQPASAQTQTIILRTGQSGGAPGTCGALDDCFRFLEAPQCGIALSAAPFTVADFAAAQSAPFAVVIDPHPAWGATLACDPDARWINSRTYAGGCLGDPRSVLYACPFEVTIPCTTASIDVCWTADDGLGDLTFGGPNPIGIYINGTALGPSFTGGNYATDTTASATNVTLASGTNWFYVYQRDAGCAVSGLNLRAIVTVGCTVSVEDESWGRVKALFR